MAKNKTTETESSVATFIAGIKDEKRRHDFSEVVRMIAEHTGLEPKLWGTSIVGFGSYHYTYDSGREGDAPLAGLAPRASAMVFYLAANFEKRDELLQSLGKHKTGKGCVYIQKLEDIDKATLLKMVKRSIEHRKKHNGE